MSEQVQKDSGNILCDMCTEEDRKPAQKTCMKCEISMCVQHLQAHLTTPVLLQTHPLTEPMAIGGNTKCPQHGKLLEYYCLDDMTCVCVSCAIEDQHRIHNMKTFSTAHKELMEKLKAEQQVLQEKTEDENVSLEKWEQSERQKLTRCSVRLLEAVTNLRDVSLTSVQSSVSARMVAIRTSKSSMEAAQKEKDTFRFLQMYSQVNQDVEKAKAVDLRKGLEPGSHCDKLVQEIREKGEKITKHTSDFLESFMILVDPEHLQELTATSSDLIFEPQIVHPGISLSKDSRKVYYNSDEGQLSPSMLYIESTASDPYFSRWVISLSTDCDWTVGLCDKHYATDMKNGTVFGLRCQEQKLISLTTEGNLSQKVIGSLDGTEAQKMSRPQTVEVMWSSPDMLSFFSRIGQYQRQEILTVKMWYTISDRVFFVCLEKNELKKNMEDKYGSSGFNQSNTSQFGASRFNLRGRSALSQSKSSFILGDSSSDFSFGTKAAFSQPYPPPLGASGSNLFGSTSVQSQVQKQWRCSCGRVYTETTDRYQYRDQVYKKSYQSSCSCGRVIGSQSVTEVLCELL